MLLFIFWIRWRKTHKSIIQIHLMLLFIFTKLYRICRRYSFKYISCYCLSMTVFLLLWIRMNSNTSHVIVYPNLMHIRKRLHIFKYISCYCLSPCGTLCASVSLLFKYISCYCLSGVFCFISHFTADSNTSHVIVYRFCCWKLCVVTHHSNTSHVIVYHKRRVCSVQAAEFKYISCYCLSIYGNVRPSFIRIQIHLMLLFIV